MKRIFDFVVALVLLVILSPVILVCLAVSAVVFRAGPLFVQPRLGLNGEVFSFVKTRSLPVQTCTTADKHQLRSVQIPWWGRFVRRSHLDELPQLLFVLTGKMALVGPRPEMPGLAATFDPDFVRERGTIRPGITGMWQVGHGVAGLIGESPEYDRFYIEHQCAALDAWILWRTFVKVCPGGRLVGLDDAPQWCRGGIRQMESGPELVALDAEGANSGS